MMIAESGSWRGIKHEKNFQVWGFFVPNPEPYSFPKTLGRTKMMHTLANFAQHKWKGRFTAPTK